MNVLEEAASLINGERQDQYGNASESHQRIADLWAGYLGTDVTEFDVVNMMILLKVSRTRNQYHRDSYVDIAGYAGLGERLHHEAAGAGIPVELNPVVDCGDCVYVEPCTGECGSPYVDGFTKLQVPRVWDRFRDVPDGVTVQDIDGDEWEGEDGYVDEHPIGGLAQDRWAPYTEVLEGT